MFTERTPRPGPTPAVAENSSDGPPAPDVWPADTLVQVSDTPRLYVYEGFAAEDDIATVLRLASDESWLDGQGIERAHGSSGYSMELPVAGSVVLDDLACRIGETVHLDNALGETLRFRRYLPGESHPPHLDTYTASGHTLILTAMLCLTAPTAGGETYFERASPEPLAVVPRRGRLVVWFNHRPDGHVDPSSFHEALPVDAGIKTTLTAFIYGSPEQAAVAPACVRRIR